MQLVSKILVIDDDVENLSVLSEMLIKEYQPILASSGREGLEKASSLAPDLILLDVNMSEMDGFEVCRRLRANEQTRSIPIIMVTTASSLEAKVSGLEMGADDYLTKPFHMKELLARIKVQFRRVQVTAVRSNYPQAVVADRGRDEYLIGKMKFVPASALVAVEGQIVHLTQMEMDLLRYFLDRPNQVISRTKILSDLWPNTVVTERTIDTHMANVRKKLAIADLPITTVYGAGYIYRQDI